MMVLANVYQAAPTIEVEADRKTAKRSLPLPRLRHVRPGQAIRLQGVPRVLVLLTTDRRYGYFTDMKASLCHEVDREMMVFGDGGWRVYEKGMT